MYILDCRSMLCPQPVVQCKIQLEKTPLDAFKVIVDNRAALENVQRFLHKREYCVNVEQISDDEWELIVHSVCASGIDKPANNTRAQANNRVIAQEDSAPFANKEASAPSSYASTLPIPPCDANGEREIKTVVYITSESVGNKNDELGMKLMESFLSTLPNMTVWHIILLYDAVRMATSVGKNLQHLQHLEAEGTKILVCGACLNHHNLINQLQVGELTNMLDVMSVLDLADKVIKP